MPTPPLPRILVCALGGTIAMTDEAGGGGVTPALSADRLVAAVPSLAGVARIDARSFRQVPGAHLTIDDVVALAVELRTAVDADYDGAVVTQGTDTLEETAFALDVLWDRAAPVVITGAMRNPTLPGADGPANLLAAVTVAASPVASGSGCLAVLGDEIHSGRLVAKGHATRPSAFGAPGAGPVGVVSEGVAHLWADIRRPPPLPIGAVAGVPRVALVRLALGDDGGLVEAAAVGGYAGLVLEAFGGGHVTPAIAEMLGRLASQMPVVVASRTGAGPTLRGTYGFAGSETDLLGRGCIPAGLLDGLKSRILLSLLLASGAGEEEIRAAFG